MRKIKLSIIIVYYEGKRELFDNLESISKNSPDIAYEVIVVSNSTDESIKNRINRYKNCKYIKSPGNIGYGAGNNFGVKNSRGEYVLILNPDTQVKKDSINNLFNFLVSRKDVGVVAPNLLHPNGQVFDQLGSRTLTPIRGIVALSFLNKLFPKNSVSQKYWLYDLDMDKKREVDVVPGACFIVKKSEFEKAGKFDENIFLYFEESDFCKRYKEKVGKKIFIIPESEVIHHWEAVKSDPKLQKIFERSRKYYFEKHYGFFWAALVEVFARFSKYLAGLTLVFFLSFFLRFYQFQSRISFHSEIGFEYLEIKHFLTNSLPPLHGPPTSHEWLVFGPYYYYLMFPVFWLTNANPLSGAYFFNILGTLLPVLFYLAFRNVFDRKFALVGALLISFSPNFITLSISSRFFSLVPILSLPFFVLLLKKRLAKKHFFLLFFILSLTINIHYAAGILIFFPVYRLFQKKEIGNIGAAVLGFVLPFAPLLIYSVNNSTYSVFKFFAWIGYRLIKSPTRFDSLVDFWSFLSQFLTNISDLFSQILLETNEFLILAFFLTLLYVITKVEFTLQRFRREIYIVLLVLFAGIGALFVQKDLGVHYFVPLYIPIILVYTYIFYLGLSYSKKTSLFLFVALCLAGMAFSFYFQRSEDEVSYTLQAAAVEEIRKDAGDEKISISRKGSFDYYTGDFADNYRYLAEWMGIQLAENSERAYIIDETNTLAGEKIFTSERLSVIKK